MKLKENFTKDNYPFVSLLSFLLLLSPYGNTQVPASPRIPVIDNYFGMKVSDYYRWMENLNDTFVQKWFEQQDIYAEKMFGNITGRDKLLADFNALDSLSSDIVFGVRKNGNKYFYLKRFVKEEKTCLMKRSGEAGKEEIIIDFKKEFPEKNFNFFPFEYSPVSNYFAFFMREANHEGRTIYFYDVVSRRFFPEQVRYSFGGTPNQTKFTQDGKGFFYYTLTIENNKATAKNSKGMLHVIGSSPGTDKVLASREYSPALADFNENSEFEVTTDPEFQYLLLTGEKNDGDYFLIAPYSELKNDKIKWKVLVKPQDKLGRPIIRNGIAYFISAAVPNGKIIKCKLGDLQTFNFETLFPEQKNKLDNISATRDYLFLRYTNGVFTTLKQYNIKSGKFHDVPQRQTGIIRTEKISEQGNEILFNVSGWNVPSTTFLYDPENKLVQKFKLKKEIKYPGAENLVVKEIEVRGHDGVMIPLSLIYHKDTKMNGSAICNLNGYGAYGNVRSPSFSVERTVLCNRGVVFAIAHVRGGGEKGEAWRLGGYKATKANTWKDLISCAEWLIKNHYTNSHHLIIEGASAGGIMVGRAMTERPDLFAIVINRVGTNDVLRHEVSGKGNIPELGTVTDSTESRYLYNMDVVQHVKEGVRYPAVICTAGMADGRVLAWQPGKLVAALQNASTSKKPVLLQVYFQGNHFGESGKSNNLNLANEWAFALWQAGHPEFQFIRK